MLKTRCGRTRSASGKCYTEETLRQHEKDCLFCQGLHERRPRPEPPAKSHWWKTEDGTVIWDSRHSH